LAYLFNNRFNAVKSHIAPQLIKSFLSYYNEQARVDATPIRLEWLLHAGEHENFLKTMNAIRATFAYFFVGLYVVLMTPVVLLCASITGKYDLIYNLARFCIRVAGITCGVRVKISGGEKIRDGQSYLFLSNHRGNLDGPVLLHAIPRNWLALIKKEMMRLPILSVVLKKIHFVPIDRQNPAKAHASIEDAAKLLAAGNSFIAFPEGTRSRDSRLGAFKKGPFVMALKAQMPVMPVSIINSSIIQPPGAYAIRPGTIEVVFHDPISTQGMHLGDKERLSEMTRAVIASILPNPESFERG
jgi:1-acyl-sn-glycerol-3-phosphate acyltransferase